MDNRQQAAEPAPSQDQRLPALQPPRYIPPRVTSYTDAEILAALGPAQTGGYAGASGSGSWL